MSLVDTCGEETQEAAHQMTDFLNELGSSIPED